MIDVYRTGQRTERNHDPAQKAGLVAGHTLFQRHILFCRIVFPAPENLDLLLDG